MNRERLFRALAEIALSADLEELNWAAAKQHFGENTVESWIQDADLGDMNGELSCMMRFIEMFHRLANGHALPKNVGLKDQMDIIYEELGIDPEDRGGYPS